MLREIKIKHNLTWRELKVLNDLYTKRKSSAKVQDSDYFKYLIDDLSIIEKKEGNGKVILATDAYDEIYVNYFKSKFQHYRTFLESNNLETDARKNYNEFDIKSLMFISRQKEQIIPNLTTQHKFSSLFFEKKGTKYLDSKNSVLKAIYKILNIEKFPLADPKENLWRFVVDCPYPKAVVLCENMDFLKTYWIAEENNIKLWYVGGNNVNIINQIDRDEFKRPFYYSGDWDLAGLKIYSRVKTILAQYNKEIRLLYPNNPNNRLPVDVPGHKSKWDFNMELSGLEPRNLNNKEIHLIRSLMQSNEWIEEESNDLTEMVNQFDC